MIIFDANILISLAQGSEGEDTYERIAGLVQELNQKKQVIGIPTPAWAEYLCGSDIASVQIIEAVKKKGAIRILPFDEKAALETALIQRAAASFGKKKGANNAPWQKVKIDRQILAVARCNQVTTIYTDDDNMIAEANRLGIQAIRSSEIPLKPKQKILKLDSEELAEATVDDKET